MTDELPLLPETTSSWLRPTHADGAERAFTWQPGLLRAGVDTAFVALDTNTLLVPYTVTNRSLKSIRSTYARLVEQRRLIVPGQVAREFARNRVSKIGEIAQDISNTLSRAQVPELHSYPLLGGRASFDAARASRTAAEDASKAYRESLTDLLRDVRMLASRDPVSEMYSGLFGDGVVVDPAFDEDEFRKELKNRFERKFPPGYKDAGKADDGYGDLLIWKTLLQVTTGRKTDLVFVTSEEKSDWWQKAGGVLRRPRYELMDEYRRCSGGGSLHLIPLSELLEVFSHVPAEVVADVRQGESSGAPTVDTVNAINVSDGRIVLVRGKLGFGAFRPIEQLEVEKGASVRYESWFAPGNDGADVDLRSMQHSSGEVGEGRDVDPVVVVGPYTIPWSASGRGSGWFYYHEFRSGEEGAAPYELALTDAERLTEVALDRARFRIGPTQEA